MSKMTRTIHQLHRFRSQKRTVQTSELDRLVTYAATHDAAAVLDELGSDVRGLDEAAVRELIETYGKNVVEEERRDSPSAASRRPSSAPSPSSSPRSRPSRSTPT